MSEKPNIARHLDENAMVHRIDQRHLNKKVLQIMRGGMFFETSILNTDDNLWEVQPLIGWHRIVQGVVGQQSCRVRVRFYAKSLWNELHLHDTAYADWTASKRSRWIARVLRDVARQLTTVGLEIAHWFPGFVGYLELLNGPGFDDLGAELVREAARALAITCADEPGSPGTAKYQFLHMLGSDNVSIIVECAGTCLQQAYRLNFSGSESDKDAMAIDEIQRIMARDALWLLLGDVLP